MKKEERGENEGRWRIGEERKGDERKKESGEESGRILEERIV